MKNFAIRRTRFRGIRAYSKVGEEHKDPLSRNPNVVFPNRRDSGTTRNKAVRATNKSMENYLKVNSRILV